VKTAAIGGGAIPSFHLSIRFTFHLAGISDSIPACHGFLQVRGDDDMHGP
jgi:hypothetical protein